jgi:TolB-like protein
MEKFRNGLMSQYHNKEVPHSMMPDMKRIVITVCILLACFFPVQIGAEIRQGIAVWDFENLSPDDRSDFGEILTTQLCEVLARSSLYTLVERSRLRHLLEEQGVGSSSLADTDYALRLGKLSGARLMVFGSYLIIGQLLRIDIRLVEVETGKILKAFKKEGRSQDLHGGMEAISTIAENLNAFLETR